jgi:hypothetical protein
MTNIKRPNSILTEADMSQAVSYKLGKYAAKEIRINGCIFDVVAYDRKERLFRVVECKRGSKASTIGHAFGQLATYKATIAAQGQRFLDVYSKKISMRLGRWMEATNTYTSIRIAFYVALTEKACKRLDLIRSLKESLPEVGIIRVKPNGFCRKYLRKGAEKYERIAQARPITVPILPTVTKSSRHPA